MHAEIKIRPHWWIAASAALVLEQVVLALTLKPGFLATAQEDISMLVLVLFAIGVMTRNALRSKGQIRVFWAFLAGSGFLWAISVWAWLYYEVLIRKAMPDDSIGDPALFIHIVPLMAAVILRPDQPQGRRKLYLQTLNLLLCCSGGFFFTPTLWLRTSSCLGIAASTVSATTCCIFWKILSSS